jgi:hypothetical protein
VGVKTIQCNLARNTAVAHAMQPTQSGVVEESIVGSPLGRPGPRPDQFPTTTPKRLGSAAQECVIDKLAFLATTGTHSSNENVIQT